MGDDAELYLEMQEPGFWDYFEEQQERERIQERNLLWAELKKMRDNKEVSQADFKRKKSEIFVVEIAQKAAKKQYYIKLRQLQHFAENNEFDLKKCIKCGCFHCCEIFTVYEIKEYPDGTAVCPYCGSKTLLPSNAEGTNEAVLEDLHSLLFPNEIERG